MPRTCPPKEDARIFVCASSFGGQVRGYCKTIIHLTYHYFSKRDIPSHHFFTGISPKLLPVFMLQLRYVVKFIFQFYRQLLKYPEMFHVHGMNIRIRHISVGQFYCCRRLIKTFI